MLGQVRPFRPKRFLKSLSPHELTQLLVRLGISADSPLYIAAETGEATLLEKAYNALTEAEQQQTRHAFSQINDFGTDDGMDEIIEAALELGIDYKDKSAISIAMLVYLQDLPCFEQYHRGLALQSEKSCQEFNAHKPTPIEEVTEEQSQSLKARFEAFLPQKEFGKQVQVEVHTFPDSVAIVLCTEDRPKVVPVFGTTGQIEHKTLRPLVESCFQYFPETGRIRLKARSKDLLELTRKSFADVCLGAPDTFEHSNSQRVWDLDQFKHMTNLATKPNSPILKANIRAIRGTISKTSKEVIEIRNFNGSLKEALARRGVNLRQMDIQKIWLSVLILMPDGTRKKKQFYLSAPHGSNLDDSLPDRYIEKQLSHWGVLPCVQKLLELA
jgi:hypothetical protein